MRLCLPHVKTYTPEQIKAFGRKPAQPDGVRRNTSLPALPLCEMGGRRPKNLNGPSLKLLNLVDKKGLEALI